MYRQSMRDSRISMLLVSTFFVLAGGYWAYTAQPLYAGVAAFNAAVAALVFRRLEDAPRAV